MIISHLSDAVRYTGRWVKREDAAITTAPGAYFEVAFCGTWCDLRFDMSLYSEPFPHLYIQVDGGAKIDARIAHFMRIETPDEGNHVVTVYFKNTMEALQRWYEPLIARVAFTGAEADGEGVLPPDNRKIIQFLGDSITEGTWVDEPRIAYGAKDKNDDCMNYRNMEYENDSTGTYAYLTAKALNMRPYIMGYGCLGLVHPANGGVPVAKEAYPCYFNGYPIEHDVPDVIVINYGANDASAPVEEYIKAYSEFLPLVREINPTAKIVVLSAFRGVHPKEVGEMVEKYNSEHNDDVLFIDSAGWVPKEPVHPLREGHRVISEHLSKILKEKLDI